MERWATFECYGTLIDWNGGIRGQLARVFGEDRADALLVRYDVLEAQLEADGKLNYREVLTQAMRGLDAPPGEEDALARSLSNSSVWINRLGEPPQPRPTRELTDLSPMPDTLDELVPA